MGSTAKDLLGSILERSDKEAPSTEAFELVKMMVGSILPCREAFGGALGNFVRQAGKPLTACNQKLHKDIARLLQIALLHI